MHTPQRFSDQKAFHEWLSVNHETHAGIWLLLDKKSPRTTLTAQEALEEALCFGWIDGQICSIDDRFYMKYFAKRQARSLWSKRNVGIVERLIREQKMMPSGMMAYQMAHVDFDDRKAESMDIESLILILKNILEAYPKALSHYLNMPKSSQRNYAIHYTQAKRPETKEKRLKEIVDLLNNNQKSLM